MAEYKILLKRTAVKELEKVPQIDLQRIFKRIETLKENPRPQGCEKLSARERYRIRPGNYRIVYAVRDVDGCVHVFKIGQRRDVYQ